MVGPSLPISMPSPERMNASPVTTSPGAAGNGSTCPERRSSSSVSLRPSTFHTSAARAPAGSSTTMSRSWSGRSAIGNTVDTPDVPRSVTASSAARSLPASVCT